MADMKTGKKNISINDRIKGSKLGWLHDSIFFIIIIVIGFCLFRFCIGLAIVGGDSMLPNFLDGDLVLYNRMVSEYARGDIVSMRVPSGDYYIKRVIATGGDTVDLIDGKVYVNGEMIDDPWGFGQTLEETGVIIYPYTVRDGNVFVLGDNRTVSMDSRMFGEVNKRQIKGRIILRVSFKSPEGLLIKGITNE